MARPEEEIRIGADQPLRQAIGLREEIPVPVAEPEGHVGAPEMLGGRQDVEHRQLQHALRVVERQAIGAAPAAVVPGDEERLEPELAHHRDLVARHRPLRVRRVVGRGRRLRAVAVAAQIGRHHREVARQARRHLVPHHVGLRMAVQQQERRPAAAMAHADRRLAGVDHRELEAGEHGAARKEDPRAKARTNFRVSSASLLRVTNRVDHEAPHRPSSSASP